MLRHARSFYLEAMIVRRCAAAAIALALTLTACSSAESQDAFTVSADSAPGLSGAQLPPSGVFTESLDGSGAAADSSIASDASAADAQVARSIVQTGFVELEVASLGAAVGDVAAVAEELGGIVVSQQVSQQGGSTHTAHISLDVPSEKFGEALEKLAPIGEVRSEQRSTDDVTVQHVDLQARVAALHTSVERLSDMLRSAESTTDLLDIEKMLSERQAQLDGLEAQLQALEGQVANSNIQVSLFEPSVLPGGGPVSFVDGLKTGFASLGSFFASAVIVVGVALPWLVLAAGVAAAVVIPLRVRRKRRRTEQKTTVFVAEELDDN